MLVDQDTTLMYMFITEREPIFADNKPDLFKAFRVNQENQD